MEIGWEIWLGIAVLIITIVGIIWKCGKWMGGLDQWKDGIDNWKDVVDKNLNGLKENISALTTEISLIKTSFEKNATSNGVVQHKSPLVPSEKAIEILNEINLTSEINLNYFNIISKVNKKSKLTIYKDIKLEDRFIEITPSVIHELIKSGKIDEKKIDSAVKKISKMFGSNVASYYSIILLITSYILEKRRKEGCPEDISKIYKQIDAISCEGDPYEIVETFDGNLKKAIESYERTVRTLKEIDLKEKTFNQCILASLYLMNNDIDKSFQQFKNAYESFKKESDKKWASEGISLALGGIASIYSIKGDFDTALKKINEAIKLNPDFYEYYFHRGNIYMWSIKYEKATQDYNKAISINPDSYAIYNNRANAYIHLDQYENAIQDMNKAIKLRPNIYFLYLNRGNFYLSLKEDEKGLKDMNKAIKLRPNSPEVYTNRAHAYHHLNRYEDEFNDLDKALKLNPSDRESITIYHNRGLTYANLSEYNKALEDFNKAIELCKKLKDDLIYAMLLMEIGRIYGEIGENNEAIDKTKEALELFEKNNEKSEIENAKKQLDLLQKSLS